MQRCEFCLSSEGIQDLQNNYIICCKCLNMALKDFSEKHNSKKNKNRRKKTEIYKDELSKYVVTFGKHRGKNILDVEPSYIKWCLNNFHDLRDEDLFKKALEQLTGERINKKEIKDDIIPDDNVQVKTETGFEF